MAEKRFLSSLILNNDDFLDMPTDAQMLYVRINLAADDRGVCDGPRAVMRTCGATNDAMKLLISKKFLLLPKNKPGVVVVKHWWIHNNARKERFKETKYPEVIGELYYDRNKSYSQNPGDGHIPAMKDGKLVWPPDLQDMFTGTDTALPPADTQWVPDGYTADTQWEPQNRIEENREGLDKESTGKSKEEENNTSIFLSKSEKPNQTEANRDNPVGLSGTEKTHAVQIKYWKDRVDLFTRQGFETDGIYAMAEANGIFREEIDSYG